MRPPWASTIFHWAADLLRGDRRDSFRLAEYSGVSRFGPHSSAIFNGYRLRLYAKVGPLAGAGLPLLFFPVQVLFSLRWLKRFRFGPVEWL